MKFEVSSAVYTIYMYTTIKLAASQHTEKTHPQVAIGNNGKNGTGKCAQHTDIIKLNSAGVIIMIRITVEPPVSNCPQFEVAAYRRWLLMGAQTTLRQNLTSQCGSRKYPYLPPKGVTEIPRGRGSERGNCPKGRGYRRIFLSRGSNEHYCASPIDSGNQTNTITPPGELSIDSLSLFQFLFLLRHWMTQTTLLNIMFVRNQVKQNAEEEMQQHINNEVNDNLYLRILNKLKCKGFSTQS